MAKNWWKAELNGVEIARGAWESVVGDVIGALREKLTTGDPGPRGFVVNIRRAQSALPPERPRRRTRRDVMLIDASGDEIRCGRLVGAKSG